MFGSDLATLELIEEGAASHPGPSARDPVDARIDWTGQYVSARLTADGGHVVAVRRPDHPDGGLVGERSRAW